MSKDRNIQFLVNQIDLVNGKMETTNEMSSFPFTSITICNGSGVTKVITIDNSMKESLQSFLMDYFAKEKDELYDKLINVLRNE